MPHNLRTCTGAGSQARLWLCRSRAGRLQVGRSGSPTRCWPGTEPDPRGLDRSRAAQGYTSVTRAWDAKARNAMWREAVSTGKDSGLRLRLTWSRGLCPMHPDSDGF